MDNHCSQDIMTLRHSAAHLLAQAVKQLYPDTLLTIGPATKEGFFYDLLPQHNFKEEDLVPIADRMRELAAQNIPLTHQQIPKDEARKLYANNKFKLELINDIPGDTVGLAQQGDFYDLCRGGHVEHTGMLKHFKLSGISGSYWRADRNNQPLQRISGVVFATEDDLKAYEQRIEEAQKYDHRRLGKQLDLFSFHDEGPGFPFFHAQGKRVIQLLTDNIRKELIDLDYQEITTPTMLSVELWKQSGHFDHYKENMYFSEIEKQQYAIRPMNCPGAILVYKERPRSYRELPLRLAEFGHVHRNELSGVLHGLFRVRAFTQDDGHIFCAPASIEDEVFATIELVNKTFAKFGFHDVKVYLSTKPDNAMGSQELWDRATDSLKKALERAHVAYEIQEGEGAFYGPKIEFHIKDSMGRTWQCGTVQVDFFQPERFELSYVSSAGTKERPVMIHRAIYGSMERFFGVLLEHFKGNLPFWLAPVQMKVLTITDEQKSYAQELVRTLRTQGYRVVMDESSDPLAGKIKTAQLERVPWMLVIGGKEVAQKTITLRHRDGKQEFGLSIEQLLEKATAYTQNYTI